MEFIPYTKQSIQKDDLQALLNSFEHPLITRGPKVLEFEKSCADFCCVKYTVLFNSGTTALTAAFFAANLNREDCLVTTPNTFVGTISGALQKTKNLFFVDIDLSTGSSDLSTSTIYNREKRHIYVPVHYAGIAQKLTKSRKQDLIIEDACQAFGSTYIDGQKVGSCPHSEMTVFSFHPAKTICMGEGGLVTTNDEELYKRLLLYRNNGIVKTSEMDPWMYEVHALTTNSNVTSFAAALGLSQLNKVEEMIEKRRTLMALYRKQLKDLPCVELLSEKYDAFSAHNLLPTLIDFKECGISRKTLIIKLKEKNIGTQVHYIPLYKHPYFKKNYSFSAKDFPNMEKYYQMQLSLPLYTDLKKEQVEYICETLTKLLDSSLLGVGSK